MSRTFNSAVKQAHTFGLRANLCRLGSPSELAAVSSHLRNYAVAETLALLGTLDSHPGIHGTPMIRRAGAQFQQVSGTPENHFAHVAPCSLLMNGMPLQTLFDSTEAKDRVARIFGMGVMAPPDWAALGNFTVVPATQNRTDFKAEAHHSAGGLVSAFETSCQGAAGAGQWLGNARHQHTADSLADYVEHHFQNVWKPAALAAYASAQVAVACSKSPATVTTQQASILKVQIGVLQATDYDFGEIAETAIASTAGEVWAP